MVKKSKNQKMFIAVRGSYLPNNLAGALTYIPFTTYLVFAMVYGWRSTDTAAMAILFIVPNWIAAVAVMTWVAKRNS